MKLILSNKLYIQNATDTFIEWCAENLVFENPDYLSRKRLGKWTGNVDPYIYMCERRGNDMILPFGTFRKVWTEFKNEFTDFRCDISPVRARRYNSNISLRDYQSRAVEAVLRGKNGILVAPCGSGKTQMGLEITARIGGKTLWLTHTQDLLTQSMTRARECFDIPVLEFGTITGGKVSVGNTLTFATVQTMSNIDLTEYRDEWDTIIVDESHRCVGSPTRLHMFYKVLSSLSARYRFGLTATPYRADGLEKCMFAILGDVLHEVKKSEVEQNTCPVKVKFFDTGYTPNADVVLAGDGTIVYSALVKDLTENEARNNFISEKIQGLKNSCVLVLSDRVEHLKKLFFKCAWICHAECIDGSMQSKAAKEKRKRILSDLNEGRLNVVFATYKLAKEGLDVPNLRYVVFASPVKDKTTVTQATGRVARKADGKEFGTIIDFRDDFGLLRGYERKRKSIYRKLKYEIND